MVERREAAWRYTVVCERLGFLESDTSTQYVREDLGPCLGGGVEWGRGRR